MAGKKTFELLLESAKKDKNGCTNWPGKIDRGGYGIHNDVLAHRKVWEYYNGPIPKTLCVCHKCDNRRCVNIEHLWLGTSKENVLDMHKKGRAGQAKLSEEDVYKIRFLLENQVQPRTIAKMFGVWDSSIHNIKSGKTWSRLK